MKTHASISCKAKDSGASVGAAHALRAKISGQEGSRGASAVIALGVFLVCAVVASVILFNATANVSRATQKRSDEKAYLALASAESLLKHDISGVTFSGSKTTTSAGDVSTSCSISNNGTIVLEQVEGAASGVFDPTKPFTPSTLTISAQQPTAGEVEGYEFPGVTATVSMDSGYNISVKLACTGSSTRTETVFFASSVERSSESSGGSTGAPTTIDKTTVTWSSPTVIGGE